LHGACYDCRLDINTSSFQHSRQPVFSFILRRNKSKRKKTKTDSKTQQKTKTRLKFKQRNNKTINLIKKKEKKDERTQNRKKTELKFKIQKQQQQFYRILELALLNKEKILREKQHQIKQHTRKTIQHYTTNRGTKTEHYREHRH
jgi:hypothetical protein